MSANIEVFNQDTWNWEFLDDVSEHQGIRIESDPADPGGDGSGLSDGSNSHADPVDGSSSLPDDWSWLPPEREPPARKPDIPARVECWVGGALVTVSRVKAGGRREQKGGGTRQPITVFSQDSRRRLMRRLAMTRRGVIPCFVTLTYPDHFPDDPTQWKEDHRKFWMRLKRKFPKASLGWRLHTLERKSGDNAGKVAPHFHMLVWGVSYTNLRAFVATAWYETVASGDEKHLRAGTQVAMPRSFRNVMKYISDELGKVEQATPLQGIGRWWGFYGRELVPWAERVWWNVQDSDVVKYMRWLRMFARRVGEWPQGHRSRIPARSYKSLSVFADGRFWCEKIRAGPDPPGDFKTWSKSVASLT